MASELFSIPDVCKGGSKERIPLHRITLYRLAEDGLIASVRVGKRVFLTDDGIQDFIDRHTKAATFGAAK